MAADRMDPHDVVDFRPFRLDIRAGRLFRNGEPVPLRPKTWAILRHLAERPGVLVLKDALIEAVWGKSDVSDDALTRTIGELRRALGDTARRARIVETVHRKGFRFIAAIDARVDEPAPPTAVLEAASQPIFVGRERELTALRAAYELAAAGRRQIVFISGEPGTGKTALLHTFLESLQTSSAAWIGWGRSTEHFGAREPYAPLLEALEHLGRGVHGHEVVSALRAEAGSWLLQLPPLQTAEDAERAVGAVPSPHGMAAEFARFVSALYPAAPLVLALEDLHWCDAGTVDLLASLARKQYPARLLIIGTYRPAEANVRRHPLDDAAQALATKGQCTTVALEGLPRLDVASYLDRRLGGAPVDERVATLVHRHTEGNALFVTALVQHLLAGGRLVADDGRWTLVASIDAIEKEVPDDLRLMLEGQLRLTTPLERDLLDAASVAGAAFDSEAVAAALETEGATVERVCERMSRARHFLRVAGRRTWPDGTAGSRYAFVHTAYQRVLRDLIPSGRRAVLHRRIAERLEAGYAARTHEIAADLADHFQRGQDRRRTVKYLQQAAAQALGHGAFRDAAACMASALVQLGDAQATPEQAREELELRRTYMRALLHMSSGSGELHDNLSRMLVLAEQVEDEAARFDALYGLGVLHANRGACTAAAAAAAQLVEFAGRGGVTAPWRAHYLAGAVALWRGDLEAAGWLLARLRDIAPAADSSVLLGSDPVLAAASSDSLRLAVLDRLEEARAQQGRVVARAERLGHAFTTAQALAFASMVHVLGGRWRDAADTASRALAISENYDFARGTGSALVCRGRALVALGQVERGMSEMQAGVALLRRTGTLLGLSLLTSLQADACLETSQWTDGLQAADEGLAHCRDTGERLFESALWRARGELLLSAAREHFVDLRDEAAQCLDQALTIARTQGARLFECAARQGRRRMSAPVRL
jgi:DNA-binding winged helix-turn-helix (wHTH) protein